MINNIKDLTFDEPYLDDEEKDIIESLKKNPSQWNNVDNQELKDKLSIAAKTTRFKRKEERITIRISTDDLMQIKKRAELDGLPYQTLITSIIHKYNNGRLS